MVLSLTIFLIYIFNMKSLKLKFLMIFGTYNGLNISKCRCMVQVNGLDTGDPLSVIEDLVLLIVVVARLHKRVEDDVAVEVYDGDAGKALTFVRLDPLTV